MSASRGQPSGVARQVSLPSRAPAPTSPQRPLTASFNRGRAVGGPTPGGGAAGLGLQSKSIAMVTRPVGPVTPTKIRSSAAGSSTVSASVGFGSGVASSAAAPIATPLNPTAATGATAVSSFANRRPAPFSADPLRLHAIAGLGVPLPPAGAVSRLAVHPSRNLAAYVVGHVVVLWDWHADKHLHLHTAPAQPVVQVKFSPDGRHLLSADATHLMVWDVVSTFALVAKVALMDAARHVQLVNQATGAGSGVPLPSGDKGPLALDFSSDGSLVCVALHGQLTLWDWTTGLHQLHSAPLTDPEQTVVQVVALKDQMGFVTVQPSVLTFWKFEIESGLVIESQQSLPRVTPATPSSTSLGPNPAAPTPDAFLSCTINPLSSFVLVLCQTGKLFVFQPSGVLVTSLTAAKARFTSVAASDTHVLLGTRTGHVQLYKSDALTFDRTVPYQLALRKRLLLSQDDTAPTASSSTGHAVSVSALVPSLVGGGRYVLVLYSDASLHVLDLQSSQIVRHQIGHFAPLSVLCPHPHPSLDNVCVAGAMDQSLGIWQAHGSSRVSVRFVDLPALGAPGTGAADGSDPTYLAPPDPNTLTVSEPTSLLPFGRVDHAPATITATCFHPSGTVLAVGDLHGHVRLFQVSRAPAASTAATPALAPPAPAVVPTLSEFTLCAAADFDDGVEITSLSFSPDGSLLAVSQRNDAIVVCEVGPPVRLLRTIYQARSAASSKSGAGAATADGAMAVHSAMFLKGLSEWQVDRGPTNYLVVTTPNRRQLQLLAFARLSAHRTEVHVVAEFNLVPPFTASPSHPLPPNAPAAAPHAGDRVTGLAVHPSENYLLVSSSKGRTWIFHLHSGDVRGVIDTPAARCGAITVDPSGLYYAVLGSTDSLAPMSLALGGGANGGGPIDAVELFAQASTSTAGGASVLLGPHALALKTPTAVLTTVASTSLRNLVPTAIQLAGGALVAVAAGSNAAAASARIGKEDDSGASSGGVAAASLALLSSASFLTPGGAGGDGSTVTVLRPDAVRALLQQARPVFTRVMVYEVGTGKFVGDVACSDGAVTLAFSGKGQSLFLAGLNGALSIYKFSPELQENVSTMLTAMVATPQVWSRYPIFLPTTVVPKNAAVASGQQLSSAWRQPDNSGAFPDDAGSAGEEEFDDDRSQASNARFGEETADSLLPAEEVAPYGRDPASNGFGSRAGRGGRAPGPYETPFPDLAPFDPSSVRRAADLLLAPEEAPASRSNRSSPPDARAAVRRSRDKPSSQKSPSALYQRGDRPLPSQLDTRDDFDMTEFDDDQGPTEEDEYADEIRDLRPSRRSPRFAAPGPRERGFSGGDDTMSVKSGYSRRSDHVLPFQRPPSPTGSVSSSLLLENPAGRPGHTTTGGKGGRGMNLQASTHAFPWPESYGALGASLLSPTQQQRNKQAMSPLARSEQDALALSASGKFERSSFDASQTLRSPLGRSRFDSDDSAPNFPSSPSKQDAAGREAAAREAEARLETRRAAARKVAALRAQARANNVPLPRTEQQDTLKTDVAVSFSMRRDMDVEADSEFPDESDLALQMDQLEKRARAFDKHADTVGDGAVDGALDVKAAQVESVDDFEKRLQEKFAKIREAQAAKKRGDVAPVGDPDKPAAAAEGDGVAAAPSGDGAAVPADGVKAEPVAEAAGDMAAAPAEGDAPKPDEAAPAPAE